MNEQLRARQEDLLDLTERLYQEAELARGMMHDGLNPQQRRDTAVYFRQLSDEMRDLSGKLGALKADILAAAG